MAASPTTAETDQLACGLVIYDGDCGFCTSAARWLEDRVQDAVTVAPWQALDVGDHGLTDTEVAQAVHLVDREGTYRGADAIAKAMSTIAGPLGLIGRMLGVPPLVWLARALYPVIARHRHRLPGATNACRLDLD